MPLPVSQREIVVEVTRGSHVESVHAVDAVIADADGGIVAIHGDGGRGVFPRSSIKALQALPLVESGAADAFGLAPHHLALACASHNGEPIHTTTSGEMLAAAGLTPACLECGAQWPHHHRDVAALVLAGEKAGAIHNNCSGKHSGFLAFAAHAGLETRGYVRFGSPVQKEIAAVLEAVTGARHGEDNYGIDGCSIPTYEIPLAALASAYARFGVGRDDGRHRSAAMLRLRDACMSHPDHICGTGAFDTAMMRAMKGRVFTKIGAEGVFTIAIPELGLGAALKCRDGNARAAEVACAWLVYSLLQQAESELEPDQLNTLKRLRQPQLENRNAITVGELRIRS
ncbi:MAG: asparaginase [Nitratireductor sp.]|nr:asparaginase [Nitratireductor sp.]